MEDESIDCAVWTYNLNSALIKDANAFAYCVLQPSTHVVKEIVEKKTISNTPEKDPLVVGSFWFRRGKDFIETAEEAIEKDISVNGEHYVGTSLNLMISEGKNPKWPEPLPKSPGPMGSGNGLSKISVS